MFSWLRKLRHGRIRRQGFPDAWLEILQRNVAFWHEISGSVESEWLKRIQVIVAEKYWEGCAGLVVEDEHRVTIAAQIARMTLGLGAEYFSEIRSILVYPDAYVGKNHMPLGSGVAIEFQDGRIGEAWYRGPVVLSWSDVVESSRGYTPGRNVVIHEFAHQLDMRNGRDADGVPVIESSRLAERWISQLQSDYARLRHECAHGYSTVLDCYGTTNLAEFFAVASESFFENPEGLEDRWPELYALLNGFYNRDGR